MSSNSDINILIGGDFFSGKETETVAINNSSNLWGDSIELFKKSDLAIINLEAPLTKAVEPIIKTGPNMKLSPACISALTCAEINIATLANNHIRDYGDQGIEDTLITCKENGVDVVGAGKNLTDASKTLFKAVKGKTIAIVNFAENEWASANNSQFGANPMDIVENTRQIQSAKEKADVVLVIIHGGHEHYQYPSPRMVKEYRFYAEQGATMVIGHHPHCISGYEVHEDVPIFYSLGNLFFPKETKFEKWFEGMLLSVNISDDADLEWSLIPYEQNKSGAYISLLKNEKKETFEKELNKINQVIADPDSLEKMWSNYSSEKVTKYLSFLISFPLVEKIIRKIGIKIPGFFVKHFVPILNLIRCEAHRDLMIAALDEFVASNNKKR